MVFGLVGHKPEKNEFDSVKQPITGITITPSLVIQRSNHTDQHQTQQQQQHMSSLPLDICIPKSKDEPSMPNKKRIPIKVDVSVKVVPKPKTKKINDTYNAKEVAADASE